MGRACRRRAAATYSKGSSIRKKQRKKASKCFSCALARGVGAASFPFLEMNGMVGSGPGAGGNSLKRLDQFFWAQRPNLVQ